ncbi:pyridoxamine 5'-phosphate oxidase family protein [Streptomyces sp. NPDC059605]|uniref:pyridoxamine 5'-phosphate oxidase family protein n=1 Tax=Streptomyces sp. NPDC059605 TaxID=3346882 RepID=UPI003678C2C1
MSSEELQAIELLGRVPYGRLATSMRALPFLMVARHVVIDGRVFLRLHGGFRYHDSCDGAVVAYGADNFNTVAPGTGSVLPGTGSVPPGAGSVPPGAGSVLPGAGSVPPGAGNGEVAGGGEAVDDGDLWAVQFTGPAQVVRPTAEQRELFGTAPARVNGEPFAPAYLRLDPHFVSVHTLGFHASEPKQYVA